MHAIHPLRTFFRPAALAVALGFLLAACGGGGDDPADQPSALAITSSNAEAVTADALQATATAASSSMASLLAQVSQPPTVMMGVEIDETLLCVYGGRFYVKGSFASANALAAGDKITLTAEGCRANAVYTVNGGLGFTVLEGGVTTGPTYPYSVTVQVDALNLSLDQSGYAQTLAGDMRVAASADSGTSESVLLTGASLRYSSASYSYTLKNYWQSVLTVNGATTATTTATVVTSNPMLGATVTSNPMSGATVTYEVSTPAALVTDASGNVLSGILKVVGGGAVLLATVTAVNVFTIQVDTDGNGSYDETQTATVAELQAMR